MHPLSRLEDPHPDSDVLGAFGFEVEAKATARGDGARHGVTVAPVRGFRITDPLPRPKRADNMAAEEDVDDDAEEENTIEDIVACNNEKHLSASTVVADTAAESCSSSDSLSSSPSEDDDPGPTPKPHAKLPLARGDGARGKKLLHGDGAGARSRRAATAHGRCFD